MNDRTLTQLSTAGGMLLSITVSMDLSDIAKSCMLAAIGTAVSYAMSRMMKALFERRLK